MPIVEDGHLSNENIRELQAAVNALQGGAGAAFLDPAAMPTFDPAVPVNLYGTENPHDLEVWGGGANAVWTVTVTGVPVSGTYDIGGSPTVTVAFDDTIQEISDKIEAVLVDTGGTGERYTVEGTPASYTIRYAGNSPRPVGEIDMNDCDPLVDWTTVDDSGLVGATAAAVVTTDGSFGGLWLPPLSTYWWLDTGEGYPGAGGVHRFNGAERRTDDLCFSTRDAKGHDAGSDRFGCALAQGTAVAGTVYFSGEVRPFPASGYLDWAAIGEITLTVGAGGGTPAQEIMLQPDLIAKALHETNFCGPAQYGVRPPNEVATLYNSAQLVNSQIANNADPNPRGRMFVGTRLMTSDGADPITDELSEGDVIRFQGAWHLDVD